MKEAISSPYAKLVFRETFNSEQSVRNNGGVPTAVTISKGVGSFNGTSSGIAYPKNFNGTYSIRIRFKEPTSFVSSQYLCDFRKDTGVGYIYCSETTISSPGGTKYKNGVASDSSIAIKELVVSGMTITSMEMTMGRRTPTFGSYFDGDLELFEIYQGTLTASEVKNLYDNDWNKELVGLNGQTMGNNLIRNGTFDTNVDDWTSTRATLTWQLGSFCRLTQNQTETASMAINQPGLTAGKRYLITFDAKAPVITSKPGVSLSHYGNIIAISNPDLSPNWQTYAYEATAKISLLALYLPTNTVSPGTVVDVDNISVVELQPKLLLDYDSTNGYITDRTGNTELTPGSITINKSGGYYTSNFNGTNSQIVTSLKSNDALIAGFSIIAWIKPMGWGVGAYGRILDKSNNAAGLEGFNFCINSLQNSLLCNLNSVGARRSATNSIRLGLWQFVVFVIDSNSRINFYVGDINTAPALSGSANQLSGLLGNITTDANLTIGNRSGSTDSAFDGSIKLVRLYSKNISLEDITQIWSSTRGKVN